MPAQEGAEGLDSDDKGRDFRLLIVSYSCLELRSTWQRVNVGVQSSVTPVSNHLASTASIKELMAHIPSC